MASETEGPRSRSISDVIDALEIAESELFFQVKRMEESVRGRTSEEMAHLADLKEGYRSAARYTGILLRYHKGRWARIQEYGTSSPTPVHSDDAITADGVAMPYSDDVESPR